MDRHSAYVGHTRHRDRMQHHYGRDDFADQSKLVCTLWRERSKDMASDYPLPDAAARGFAERREFRFGEIARDMVAKARGLRAAMRATAIAKYFRNEGMRVFLMIDSLTRIAHAQREIGLALGEPPTMTGYPPSALGMIPRLPREAQRGFTTT
jgi:ATP synthase alpha/beta family, nucleotide-binding domain